MSDVLNVNSLKNTYREPSYSPPTLTFSATNVITIVISVVSLAITLMGFYFGWKAYTEIMENIKPQLYAITNFSEHLKHTTPSPQKSPPDIIHAPSH